MSYRTFKHLIGETSLERKCRFIFGGAILILITASFFWYGRKTEQMVYDQNRESCRLLANRILLRHHWIRLETMAEFRPMIEPLDQAFAEIIQGDVKQYQSRFIRPGSSDQLPRSEFEYEALEAFQKGKSLEHTRVVAEESSYQYIGAVTLKQECIACHSVHGNGRSSNDGDLWAAVSVTIPLDTAGFILGMAYERKRGGGARLARLSAQQELLKWHWKALESDSSFRPIIDLLAEQGGEPAGVRIVGSPPKPTEALDSFEMDALAEIDAGGEGLWELSGHRYAVPIRAAEVCMACHEKRAGAPTQVNDLLGVAIVDVTSH